MSNRPESSTPNSRKCGVSYPHPPHDECDGSAAQPWPFPLRDEAALLPGLREALLWKPNTPQLENAMTYAWEAAIKSFIRAIEANAPAVQSETPAIAELRRLREIEHLAWHVCESSEEDVSAKTITVDPGDFEALSKALPMEHPSHDGLPKGAKSHG